MRSWLARFAQQVGKEKAFALTQVARQAAILETREMMTQHTRVAVYG
jgi:hypothetical protein